MLIQIWICLVRTPKRRNLLRGGDQQGSSSSIDYTKTPRTTASFIPGYDWNLNGGFFDELATDMQKKAGFDFEESYENDWMPNIDD
jgi:hypothetical protein